MNTPKRYTLRLPEISYGTEENPSGEYVRYADYAALQAENERLKETCEITFGRIDALFIRLRELQAENYRLRKAGDAMAAMFRFAPNTPPRFISEWLAAKGVQS